MTLALPVEEEHISSSHEGFVELEELIHKDNEFVWKETARWIKYEEDVEECANRWGKPHIPCLNFASVRHVKNVIQTGAVLLDLNENNLQNITLSVVERLVASGSLHAEQQESFISVLLTRHLHHLPKKRASSVTSHVSRVVPSLTSAAISHKSNIKELSTIKEDGPSTDLTRVENGQQEIHEPEHSFLPDQISSTIERKIPKNAEATTVLVGIHDELSVPVGAFVRLLRGSNMGNLAEVKIPVRFLFILLGPENGLMNYHEVGRSVATLMTDKLFLDSAYLAENGSDLLLAIDTFMGDSILIPPGDWDRHVLSQTIPMLADQSKETETRRKSAAVTKAQGEQTETSQIREPEQLELEDTLERSGTFCGGLVRDVKRRFALYKSDITDSFNSRCAMATVFVYLACLAPAISFGGLLHNNTASWMGVSEMIFATALCGIIFALFAGQPLIIIGATGPLLVFEKNTYALCEEYDLEYLPWRAWVGIWVMVICFGIVACEGCFMIRYFTRFTEEIFALMISLIFIYDGLSYIWKMFDYTNQMKEEGKGKLPQSSPEYLNTALFATILLFGTFFIAHSLRNLRHSHYFGHVARRIVSDFGVLIAIVAMIFLDRFGSKISTQKLEVPEGFTFTSPHRSSWLVNPMGIKVSMSVANIVAALIPAVLVSILLFMEVEFCNLILDKKDNKLKKGPGYNLDLFIVGLLVGLCSILGLPWMCASPVHTVSHFHALSVLSTNNPPGEHPHLIEVKEQRVTNVAIHLLIGVTVLLAPVLRLIPISVLFGVFVFLGVSSLSHLQLCERTKLLFTAASHHPDLNYVRNVSTMKMHMFTIVQLLCMGILITIKLTAAAPLFPFFIICLIPVRKFLERFYKESELDELDNEVDETYDSDLDDFDSIHVPT